MKFDDDKEINLLFENLRECMNRRRGDKESGELETGLAPSRALDSSPFASFRLNEGQLEVLLYLSHRGDNWQSHVYALKGLAEQLIVEAERLENRRGGGLPASETIH